jgi:(2Fe-2S) ferredoxin
VGTFRQIFVCATPGDGRCGAKGGSELLEAFKEEVEHRGFPSSAVLRNVCTRRHEEGPIVFIFPDDVWYTSVKPEEVPEIVERHLVSGKLQASGIGRVDGVARNPSTRRTPG